MTDKYPEVTKHLSGYLRKLHKEIPCTMNGFSTLAKEATSEGALSEKTKELMALAIGISVRCEGCIGFHVKKLVQLEVRKDEFLETLSLAIYMGGGPSLMFAAEALEAFEEFSSKDLE
jgi:AhpD family alkylhydroperoxidase